MNQKEHRITQLLFKAVLSLMLVFVGCCLWFLQQPAAVYAKEIIDSGMLNETISWNYADSGTLTLNGSGDIADSENAYPWFEYAEEITAVVFNGNFTAIGDACFIDCHQLNSIVIPNSVTSIGARAFKGCNSLTAIEIPSGVTSIEANVFSGCNNLSSIKIPNGITRIGANAFSDCKSLTTIEIPKSVTSISEGILNGCASLESLSIPFVGSSRNEKGTKGTYKVQIQVKAAGNAQYKAAEQTVTAKVKVK